MDSNTLDQQLREPGEIQTGKFVVTYGMIGGFLIIITSLILYFINLQNTGWAWLTILFFLIVVIAAQKKISSTYENYVVTSGTLFKAGMKITLICLAATLLYTLFYSNVLDTDSRGTMIETARKNMAEKGMSEETIDMYMAKIKFVYQWPFLITITIIMNLVLGAIVSGIGAAIFKKEQ